MLRWLFQVDVDRLAVCTSPTHHLPVSLFRQHPGGRPVVCYRTQSEYECTHVGGGYVRYKHCTASFYEGAYIHDYVQMCL